MRLHERYRVIKIIGQGVFGKTFLAIDESQSPPINCVIKQLDSPVVAPENFKQTTELFEQKALLLKELGKHPQIPALLDYFEEDRHFHQVQEFIDGTNLAKVLEEEGTFNESQILLVLNDLLPVLKFIHDRQVIHQDINPANIIRRHSDKSLILVDFSAAKLVTTLDSLEMGTGIGSAEYVAPEQTQGKAVFASDLYSLGVTCIYLMTGISPFDLFDVANNCWVWRQYVLGEVSDCLSEIINKLLENAISHRFQSADEVMQSINPNYFKDRVSVESENNQWQCIQTITGHSGLFAAIGSVAISPNGEILASGSDDKTIKLWNLKTGEEIVTLAGHSRFVKSVAFSSDGAILASASDDRTIKLWNVATGEEIRTLSGHSHAVKSVAFSPQGSGGFGNPPLLASGSWDKTVKLWDTNTGEIICTLTGHQLQITSIAFSLDGKLLASGSFDRTVRLWDLSSRENSRVLYTLKGHSWPVFAIAFSPQGNILATGSEDKTIILWDLNTGQQIRTLSGHSWSVVALAFSPDGETLISGSWDKMIKIWRVSNDREIATLPGHLDSVLSVAIDPTGQFIASSSNDLTIKLWRSD